MHSEAIALQKATELAERCADTFRALGVPPRGPIMVATDNKAALHIATNKGSAKESKHLLRHFYTSKQRHDAGLVVIKKVDDADNPADFLTKPLPLKKLEKSIRYVTNHDGSLQG